MFLQVHYSVSGQTKPLFPAFLIQPLGLLLLNKQSTKKPEGKWSVKAKFIHLKCGSWPYTIHLGKSLKRPIVRLGGCRNLHIINYYPNYTVFKVTIFLWQLLAYVEQLYINMLEVWVFVCVCVCVCLYWDEYLKKTIWSTSCYHAPFLYFLFLSSSWTLMFSVNQR